MVPKRCNGYKLLQRFYFMYRAAAILLGLCLRRTLVLFMMLHLLVCLN